jgi:anthranilate phosphoribosyltransferase
VVGVSDPALLELIAGAPCTTSARSCPSSASAPGMDELSPLGPSEVVEVDAGRVTRYVFDPVEALGWERFGPEGLEGGERRENARKVEDVLRGKIGGAARAAVLLNAGAALYVAGTSESLVDGVHAAETALDAGKGWDKLRELREAAG